MGELGTYAGVAIRLRPTQGDPVRVRTCAVWPANDLRNVLGTITSRDWLPAFGPVKHPEFSAGIGYVVPLQDPAGGHCRGYLSLTVIDRAEALDGEQTPSSAQPLPDPRAAWRGPCFADAATESND